MDPITFRAVGEVAKFQLQKTEFLMALREWSERPIEDFSPNVPPVGALRLDFSDENSILARVFKSLALAETFTDRLALLQAAIAVHQRRYELAWNYVPSSANPRLAAPRDGRVALAPYSAMIERLRDWLEALFDQACGVEP